MNRQHASARRACILHVVAAAGRSPEYLAGTHDVAAAGGVLDQLTLDHHEDHGGQDGRAYRSRPPDPNDRRETPDWLAAEYR
jgi:hypothetical protein